MVTPGAPLKRKPPRFFYGWNIVGVAFAGEFTVSAIGGATVSLFFAPMRESLGWSITALTSAVAIRAVAGMASGPFIGMVLDRRGPRVVMSVGAAVAGLAVVLLAGVQAPWQFWLLFGAVGAVGLGEPGHIATPVAISKWFLRKRGRAMAVATQGQLLGGVAMTPVVAYLIVAAGWRTTWILLGIFVIVLNVPLTSIFMRRQPEDVGLLPDGDEARTPSHGPGAPAAVPMRDPTWTLSEALRTPTFWLLVTGFNFILFATISVVYHQVLYFTGEGLSTLAASYVLMASLLGGVLSRFLWGALVDRLSIRVSITAVALFRTIGTVALIVVPYPLNIVPFLLFWGFLGGAVGLLLPLSFANYYGRAFQGRIQGILRPLLGTSTVIGPLSLAVLFDVTGTYTVSFGLAGGLAACSVLLFALARVPAKRQGGPSRTAPCRRLYSARQPR